MSIKYNEVTIKKWAILSLFFLLLCYNTTNAQTNEKKPWFYGMYFQWGYNRESYSKSNIHFSLSNGDRFTLHRAKANDSPDFGAILKSPGDISIPQYSYRIGFYLNPDKTRAVEINFDHMKYVVTDYQKVLVTGTIDHQPVHGDSILNPGSFLHLEHTDGANLLHINYVQQNTLFGTKRTDRKLLTWLWKVGAGINIPRTDFTWRGERLNNKFHIAGYNTSAETAIRLYPFKKIFIEASGKAGYVNYLNALANTPTQKGNRVNHDFFYVEAIATIGFDINFHASDNAGF